MRRVVLCALALGIAASAAAQEVATIAAVQESKPGQTQSKPAPAPEGKQETARPAPAPSIGTKRRC